MAQGLLESNVMWLKTLREAAGEKMSNRKFRHFFASVIVNSSPPDPMELFNAVLDDLCSRRPGMTEEQVRQIALNHLEFIFQDSHGKTCA